MARRTRNPIGSDSDSEARRSQSQHDNGVIMDDLVDPDKTLRHLFLQAFISRRVIEVGLAQRLYKECAKMCALPHDNFAGFISTLEDGLSLLGLDIKRTRDQESGLSYTVLINTAEDAASKMATDFKPEEIAFFRAIVGEIMSTDDLSYSVTMKEALRCMKGSRMIAQELVRSFIAKGLAAPASLATLDFGYACPNDDCPIRLHSYCVEARVNQGRCPGSLAGTCQETWIPIANGKYVGTIIGIKAIAGMEGDDEFEDEIGGGASSTPLGPTSTAASRATNMNGRSGGAKERSGEARGARGGRVVVSDEEVMRRTRKMS
ncbi:hypothetical protein MVLG_06099 [Microbotryum lychnidis-dioicae p1A1 Lamole]|uniref:Non-structural maintenance of chromosomes element 1 homolog n=1 Tax=Microbotryum lychnidis-dioicae (strain p1A1 Lamole / MvSl-1064) TaxID=683840 RepID=U5HG86_USTV1|nr:hypothetical protein MVLG_06099 [Microbotryum lychnidis-dioicae p1A1 Lamole]|eukprot:KDE03438.1 hypothetical protein MVLG_06099 [Microbotryum lychnidis-dioicae p1A1 Lamole]